jgi:hypothetical protein
MLYNDGANKQAKVPKREFMPWDTQFFVVCEFLVSVVNAHAERNYSF